MLLILCLFADDTNLFIVSDDPNHLKNNAKIVFIIYLSGLQQVNYH